MKKSTSTFFMILSQSLIIFIIFGILTTNKEISSWLLTILGMSFLFAYTGGILYPKLLNKYGEKHYKLILVVQHIFLSSILYITGNMLGYITDYISFIIQYFLLFIVIYYMNRKIYIKEIKDLDNIIKNSKQQK